MKSELLEVMPCLLHLDVHLEVLLGCIKARHVTQVVVPVHVLSRGDVGVVHLSERQDLLHAQMAQHALVIVELLQSVVESCLLLRATLDRFTQVLAVPSLDLFD